MPEQPLPPGATGLPKLVQEYLEARAQHRGLVSAEFRRRHPQQCEMLSTSALLVTEILLEVSGKDLRPIDHGPFLAGLMVSFCRTHYVAVDLTIQGELIEAVCLLRKQVELLARMHELMDGSYDERKLDGKTPNVKRLWSGLKRQYSAYSEVAHSAKQEPLWLLGWLDEGEDFSVPLFPVYHHNSAIQARDLAIAAGEFWALCEKVFLALGNVQVRRCQEVFQSLVPHIRRERTSLDGDGEPDSGA